jgi:glycosyltransferase involved in cell wall biosynthesis
MISLVLPAHNEARSIRSSVSELDRELSRVFDETEILVVDDGSTDQTLGQLDDLDLSSQLVLIRGETCVGKGRALRIGFSLARGTVVAYTDADMPIAPRSVSDAIAEVASGRCDVCVGYRHMASLRTAKQRMRTLASWAYKTYVRLLFAQLPRDPACCLKVFSRQVAATVAADATRNDYIFDIEALLIASVLDADIKDITVAWTDKRSKLPLLRLAREACKAFRVMILLRREHAALGSPALYDDRKQPEQNERAGKDLQTDAYLTCDIADLHLAVTKGGRRGDAIN